MDNLGIYLFGLIVVAWPVATMLLSFGSANEAETSTSYSDKTYGRDRDDIVRRPIVNPSAGQVHNRTL